MKGFLLYLCNVNPVTTKQKKLMEEKKPLAQNGEIILYQPDSSIRLEVRMKEDTVWLTQAQMAKLFGTQRAAITKHLNNIYKSGEIERERPHVPFWNTWDKMEQGSIIQRITILTQYYLSGIASTARMPLSLGVGLQKH